MTANQPEAQEEGLGTALHRFTGIDEAPRIYADAINLSTSIYGTSLYFGTRSDALAGSPTRLLGVVFLSPQMAKTLTCLLIKQLRGYERDIGKIAIPPDLAKALTIAGELEQFEALEVRDGN